MATARRDALLELQGAAQAKWAAAAAFEAEAPTDPSRVKFFGNFPYPYMNGLLHLGHAFSLSKLEFASAYHRLRGDVVLFPQGFHCTGMPIKACADKLVKEAKAYGNPPQFPAEEAAEAPPAPPAEDAGPADPTKFKAQKSKAAAKKGKGSYQWEIMESMGIPAEEIGRFQESTHWLEYFPPLAKRDMALMGCGIDWRRSFITTDANPFYDSFVQWQFRTLKARGKIVKDKRNAVYSPIDGQPCADHDRASGEGVGPQEYVLVKMRALELPGKLAALKGKAVFLMAATLRPETMYGQTNAWVLPDGDYGAFEGLGGEVYVMTARAALNLSYQDQTPEWGKPNCLVELKGHDLMGLALQSPLSQVYEKIHVLPMLTVSTKKGTGVVTSVPSDSADDFMALTDLKKKAKLREKYGVLDEWVLPFEPVPVLAIPGFGDLAAPKVCADLKIQSQNDRAKLDEAKKLTYLKGFTDGVMTTGAYAGKPVKEAKPLIRQDMLDAGSALLYSEPEKEVMSRSGGECVVALTDQWYLTYGEEGWEQATREALEGLEAFGMAEVTNAFGYTLGWMKQWACSRSFGLGTAVPWDPQYLIESLSDSTIYMAYYTVAHILQQGDMYGRTHTGVRPEDLTDAVWDYVFLGKALPENSGIAKETLERMRAEFEYWYPFDLRVSGKDLIQNHLTFCLYNHTAIFPKEQWPKGMRCNGHLLLNNEKMSKSTGNFKTLNQAIHEYSADAMRFALADAGDGLEDANFVHDTANGAILRLTKELDWIEECLGPATEGAALRTGAATSFSDRVFSNAMDVACRAANAAYEKMLFREALKVGFYELQAARDTYRVACGAAGMHRDLVARFVEVQAKLLAPICPHTCEHIWAHYLKREGLIVNSGWPASSEPDFGLVEAQKYLESTVSSLRSAIAKQEAPPKKKKGKAADAPKPPKVVGVRLAVAPAFSGWRAVVLEALAGLFDAASKTFPDTVFKDVLAALAASPEAGDMPAKKLKQLAMPFTKFKSDQARVGGAIALGLKLPFDEASVIEENMEYVKATLKLQSLSVGPAGADVADAFPGTPNITYETEAVAEATAAVEGMGV